MINLEVPVKDMDLTKLKAGDVISLSGNILTARDQAHKRILEQGAPCDIEGAAIFHAGPIITNKGSEDEPEYEIVAVGPTTSMRMNPYQKDVIALGPKIVIGKGGMDDTVREALKEHNAIYVVATGGCAALYVDAVEKIESVDWLDLGMPEAMWNLKVDSFGPLIVAMDSHGNSLYD
ncbi:FumA C-terminus/TtdB family hydratase beta subunit [Methanobrevibacter woesei]|uniref:FumA C-terminus/TtdB family hydratase beta subunit n=1 Tax=Methanobrevibacter woesei TaxID=190976 RepID=UPI002357506F|nr:FumA C-terminus/TtdB family hydratase beta subunit [Methanobrevibacter woesei]